MKPELGNIVCLALLIASTGKMVGSPCQQPEGVPYTDARGVVEGLVSQAEGVPKGTYNLRFQFDPEASKEDRLMWQKLVVEVFFQEYADQIAIEIGPSKIRGNVAPGDNKIDAALEFAAKGGIEVAIYYTGTGANYRLTRLVA